MGDTNIVIATKKSFGSRFCHLRCTTKEDKEKKNELNMHVNGVHKRLLEEKNPAKVRCGQCNVPLIIEKNKPNSRVAAHVFLRDNSVWLMTCCKHCNDEANKCNSSNGATCKDFKGELTFVLSLGKETTAYGERQQFRSKSG
eukprot:TRINITY_DN27042_c0_g1_i1.p1 TRINITY_DN27042_c0_g1~~TRINITY_DN27042_c0_g1_i1.p1  ORF type:complete len:142 (+),score=8.64 TRINITY_DN27042_c0_g1_i1:13-438(+)